MLVQSLQTKYDLFGYRADFCCLYSWQISAQSPGMKFKKQNQDAAT